MCDIREARVEPSTIKISPNAIITTPAADRPIDVCVLPPFDIHTYIVNGI